MAAEIWDLYDGNGFITDRTMVRGEEVPAGLYHLVVHIWPMNDRGEFLIQQRSMSVQWKPGVWAVTGGAAVSGEDALTAARRELSEELGYDAEEGELIKVACLKRVNSFCNVYSIRLNLPESEFVLQREEVQAVKWCSGDQLLRMVGDNTLYNYGDVYFRMLMHYRRTCTQNMMHKHNY